MDLRKPHLLIHITWRVLVNLEHFWGHKRRGYERLVFEISKMGAREFRQIFKSCFLLSLAFLAFAYQWKGNERYACLLVGSSTGSHVTFPSLDKRASEPIECGSNHRLPFFSPPLSPVFFILILPVSAKPLLDRSPVM